jgi:hypothetical protein
MTSSNHQQFHIRKGLIDMIFECKIVDCVDIELTKLNVTNI